MQGMKTFIRTIYSGDLIECSWYSETGKRYMHRFSTMKFKFNTVKECDDIYGYMAYTLQNKGNFNIIDNYIGKHPKRIS
jgi:hypothetical protein